MARETAGRSHIFLVVEAWSVLASSVRSCTGSEGRRLERAVLHGAAALYYGRDNGALARAASRFRCWRWLSVSALRLAPSAAKLPPRLTDTEFWTLIADLSEPNGTFRSENLLSNEARFQFVIPDLVEGIRPGGVYLGVGPEQNFTYIAAVKPAIAFIVDVRRGNLDLHLMYKALFELSADRADFVSRLFSRKRPAGLRHGSTAAQIFAAYAQVEPSDDLYQRNLRDIQRQLVIETCASR